MFLIGINLLVIHIFSEILIVEQILIKLMELLHEFYIILTENHID